MWEWPAAKQKLEHSTQSHRLTKFRMSTDQGSSSAQESQTNACSGNGEEPTRSVILADGRVFNIPVSWSTKIACQQLRQRFNLVGGGFDIGICAVKQSENIQIGSIRRGQLYFRDYKCLTYVDAAYRIGHLVLQGVKALARQRRLLKKKKNTKAVAPPQNEENATRKTENVSAQDEVLSAAEKAIDQVKSTEVVAESNKET